MPLVSPPHRVRRALRLVRTRRARRAGCVLASAVVLAVACTQTTPPKHGNHRQSLSAEPTVSPEPTATFTPAPPGVKGKPNILLILTDDQTLSEMGHMATVQSELAGKGLTFRNGFVVNPLCCPTRTTILTGRYSHSTHVYRNIPPYGGFQTFGTQDRSTIATWLQKDGYRTALIGKYLNGYKNGSYEPPGWDTWRAYVRTQYVNYSISVDGKLVRYGSTPAQYATTVLGNDAVRFIDSVPSDTPLFLYFAPKSAHAPATPEPRYARSLAETPLYRPPNYNEADTSDKPPWLRRIPQLTPSELAANDLFIWHQNQTLLSADDQIRRILDELAATHRLSNTFIVFFSDNGLENGSHRLLHKGVPYEESIHVPMIIRYDPITKLNASGTDALALDVDLAPTFAAIAGVTAPGAEGTSLLPILRGEPVRWRDEFVIEHMAEKREGAPTFCAVRTMRYKYVLYLDGAQELYDLQKDPYELRNQAGSPAFAGLATRLRADVMRLCSPPPPGWKP